MTLPARLSAVHCLPSQVPAYQLVGSHGAAISHLPSLSWARAADDTPPMAPKMTRKSRRLQRVATSRRYPGHAPRTI